MEVAEAGIAGAEIVERDGDAEPAQLVELMVDARVVVEQHVLGELELDQAGRDVGGLRSGRPSRLAMPPRRSWEGDRLMATRGGAMPPARQRPIWPSASARTQAPRGSIRPVSSASGRKAPGASSAALRVLPAQERLQTGDRAVGGGDLGLVVQLELAVLDAAGEVAAQQAAGPGLGGELGAVVGHARPAGGLGAVEGDVGVGAQLVGGAAIVGEEGDADAGADHHVLLADAHRLAPRPPSAARPGWRRRSACAARSGSPRTRRHPAGRSCRRRAPWWPAARPRPAAARRRRDGPASR